MTTIELEMYQSVPSIEFNTYWIPCTWFIMLLKEVKNTRINDAQGLKIIMEEFNEFRSKCGLLWSYDWVSIPLVYTQVVTIATYSFFMAALVGRQFVDEAKKPFQMEIDIYLPVFTILQFFFFMGLLKVAEQLINPFGDDDEDFELNWLIDRHTKVSYLGVDLLMMQAPPLVKDMYFDDVDLALPYTEAAVAYKKKTYRGSVHNMTVPEEQHTMFLPEITEEDEEKPAATPRSSTMNLQAAACAAAVPGAATAAVPGAATAAGIWWSHPSSQSLCKSLDQTDSVPSHQLEEVVGETHAFPSNQMDRLLSKYGTTRPVMRSESTPMMKRLPLKSGVEAWSSVSTLCQSQLSLQFSQLSPDTFGSPQPCPTSCASSTEPDNSQHTQKPSPWPPVPADLKPCSSASNFENVSENLLKSQQSKSNRKPKMKSCPKLVQVRRQSPSSGNKKKGVRWKPIVQGPLGPGVQRRRTVDVIPEIVEVSKASPTRDAPLYCTQCQNMVERKGSVGITTTFDTHPVPNTRLEGWAYSGQHFLSVLNKNKEEGTVSAPNLTSSEIAKMNCKGATSWQYRLSSGFLKKIGLGHKKHPKSDLALFRHVSPITFIGSPKWTNDRKFVSQSLPNIVFPNTLSSSMMSVRSGDIPNASKTNQQKDVVQIKEGVQEYHTNGNYLDDVINGTQMTTDSSDNHSATNPSSPNLARTFTLSSNSSSTSSSFRENGSWRSADWSTLLNTSACNLELLPSLDSSPSVHVYNPSDIEANKDDVLEEVVINREHSPNTRWS